MTIYTKEIQKIFKTTPCPYPGFIVDMVEYQDEGYVALRFYKPLVEDYSESQKMELAQYLMFLEEAINSTGTKCVIERSDNAPPNRRVR